MNSWTTAGRVVVILSCLLVSSCGYVPKAQQPGDEVASGVRSPSPSPIISPLPTPTGTNPRLAAGDCVAVPAGNRTQPMGDDQVSVQVPPGWTDTTSTLNPARLEAPVLQLSAPADYGNSNVVFVLTNFLGPRPGSSSHHELEVFVTMANQGNWKVIGSIVDCSVAGELASFVELAHDSTIEYWVFVLHHPDQPFPYLFVAKIIGQGGIDDRSMLDAKRVMGSWTWGK